MDHNPLGDDGLIAIAQSLRHNATLRELDVGDCDVGIRGVTALCVAVFERNTTLKSLGMENPSRLFTHQSEHVFHASRITASSGIADGRLGSGASTPTGSRRSPRTASRRRRTWSA